MCPPLIELSSISENLKIENCKCKRWPNIYCTFKGEGRSLKRIAFGILLMLLTLYAGTIMVKANSATDASIVISPPNTTVPRGSSFTLNLTINDVTDMYAWSVTLIYQKIISMNSVDTINGTDFTDGTGLVIIEQQDYNSSYYECIVARTLLDVTPGVTRPGTTGSGVVAQLNFIAVSVGTTGIYSVDSEIINSQSKDITHITLTTLLATVTVVEPSPPPSRAVGGFSFSVYKPASLAPYVGLALITAIIATVATAVYAKRAKRRKDKQ
jgi:hypothetical protein